MKVKDILRKNAAFHRGWQPNLVSICTISPEKLCLRRLRKIPGKITAYFDRSKIANVFKSMGRDPNAYYIIAAYDGTWFMVEY